MEFPQLDASVRSRTGKGPARRLRQQGQTPAVLYGSGFESVSISLSPAKLVTALAGPLHTNTVLALTISGGGEATPKECKVLVVDHQYDPVSRELLHVDFATIDVEKEHEFHIPLKLTGRSIGELEGGTLSIIYRELPLVCLPKDIPVSIGGDVSNLGLNDQLTLDDLEIPENVKVDLPASTAVAVVLAARAEEEVVEEEEEGEGEGEGEGEAGAEGDEKGKEGADAPKKDDPSKSEEKSKDKSKDKSKGKSK